MTPERPNIVFILTDDQGPWAAGCYGNPELRTPNIDRIAATGMRFDNFFCASPVCSPSRASFLTGQMPSAHGVHDWIRGGNYGDDAATYLEGQTDYTDLLAQAGWTCGISGKWHLGNSVLPQHGFSHWFVHKKGGGPYNDAPMIRNGELFNAPGYLTNVITDDALGFIDRHAASAAPFYLSVHYTAPHSPWTGHPQAIVDSYDDCPFASCPQEEVHPWAGSLTRSCLGDREMLKGYFAAVTAMDRDVGRILERLEQHGIRQRTLVVFTSDNGFSCGHHGFWGKGNGTFPLNMYENSVKVPFLVSHPGRVPAGRVVGELFSAIDFMPTLLAYAGVDLPEALRRGRAGRSFAELLEGGTAPARDRVVIYDEYGATRMIRTAEWKYVQRYPVPGLRKRPQRAVRPGERSGRASQPGGRPGAATPYPRAARPAGELVRRAGDGGAGRPQPAGRRRRPTASGGRHLGRWLARLRGSLMACCCSAGDGGDGPGRRGRGGPCPGTDGFFSREAPRMVRRYRRRGLEAVQRKLLEGLTTAGVAGASVLEIGCGTGELQRRVLAAGAAGGVGIDVAGGMIDEARAAAEREGLQERATFLVGDAVERAAELPPAALVVLDKVLCCYPEIDTLLAMSLARSERLYAVVVPRPHWLVAAVWRVAIAVFKLLRSSFHPYYHDWNRTAAAIAAAGFRRIFAAHTLAWEAWIFHRS